MYFWLKFFHIAAMAVWFVGLFFLPRLFVAHRRDEADGGHEYFLPVAKSLFFSVMTPAGLVAIVLGMILIGYGPQGAWLVMKLALVTVAVLLHLYLGVVLYDIGRDHDRHRSWFYRLLGALPLLLLLALAALTAAKPISAPGLPPPPTASAGLQLYE